MILGFLGYGTVGSTIGARAHELGFDVVYRDPHVDGSRSLAEVGAADVVFVCVPTPPTADGTLNTSIVEAAIGSVADSHAVVISSTLNPGTCQTLRARYPNTRFAHVPEFLRQAHAASDFVSSPRVVIGSDSVDLAVQLRALYRKLTPDAVIVETSPLVAEIAKLASNAFLATKVVFANEIAEACGVAGAPWAEVADILALDPRIGGSHLRVTPEGGFDGACLPKDTEAFAVWLRRVTGRESLPGSAVETNKKLRANRPVRQPTGPRK
jgi:UDPglucose 6-dehydrogenase